LNTAKQISDTSKRGKVNGEDEYLVYTTEGDVVKVVDPGDVAAAKVAYTSYANKSRQEVGALATKFRLRMLAKKKARWRRNLEEGAHLDTDALARFVTGGDPRVYKRKVVTQTLNTRIVFLVDHSGSMGGRKLEESRKAVIQLAEAADQVKVPFAIYGYSTADWDTGKTRRASASYEEQTVYTRWGSLLFLVYKEFDEDWRRIRHRLANFRCYNNTYNGESVQLAARKLLEAALPDERLVLFDFMDGLPEPNCHQHRQQHEVYLQKVVADVEKAGIEAIGIGIQTDATRRFYKKCIVISDAADLAKAGLKQLEATLLGQETKAA